MKHINRLVSYFSVCFLKHHLKPDLNMIYTSCWAGIAAFTRTTHWVESALCKPFEYCTLNPSGCTFYVQNFRTFPGFFSCFFLSSQVEDETTLNEVPCDLSRFHAQLRDHSPLGSWNDGDVVVRRIWGIFFDFFLQNWSGAIFPR